MPVLVLIADGDMAPAVVEAGLGAGYAAHPRALLYLLTFELGEHSEEANHGLAEWGRCVEALCMEMKSTPFAGRTSSMR